MCLTSVTRSSWCCCSCWMPVTTRKRTRSRSDPAAVRISSSIRASTDCAEAVDLVVGRPGHQSPVVAPDAGSERLVVRVEDILQPRVVFPVEAEGLEHVLGEEPGGVAEVPPRRADVRHGLDAVVLRPQGAAELEAQVPGLAVAAQQVVSVHGGPSSPPPIVSVGSPPDLDSAVQLFARVPVKPARGLNRPGRVPGTTGRTLLGAERALH